MSDEQQQAQPPESGQQAEPPHEATCPKCGHHFWHKIGDALKDAAEGLGTAIGETKFDQT